MNYPTRKKCNFLLLLVLTLCFNGVTPALGDQKLNPCTLVTKSEIENTTGNNVRDSKLVAKKPTLGSDKQEIKSCQYMFIDSSVLIIKTAEVNEPADKVIERQKRQKEQTVSDVPGLADKSFFISGFGMLQLNTYKGNTHLLITMTVPDPSKELAMKSASEKLMRMALTKL